MTQPPAIDNFVAFVQRSGATHPKLPNGLKALEHLQATVQCYLAGGSANVLHYETKHILDIDPDLIRFVGDFLAELGICFVCNIADGVGHWIQELDYFARKKALGTLDLSKKYLLIRKPHPNALVETCTSLYRGLFDYVAVDNDLYHLLLPLMARRRDLGVNVGLSRLRWQEPEDRAHLGRGYQTGDPQAYLYQVTKAENHRRFADYYQLRRRSVGFTPLKFQGTKADLPFKLSPEKRVALIHLKTDTIVNATAAVVDPTSYLPTIQFLRDNGFDILFVGRERMPELFAAVGVLNYAQSPFATFENDIKLASIADFTLVSSSGLFILADCFERPLLYINSWHAHRVPFSATSRHIPCTMVNRATGAVVPLREQMSLYEDTPEDGGEVFPSATYEARNATADEILEGTKECLAPNAMASTEQQLFSSLQVRPEPLVSYAWCSGYFLSKHPDLLR